MPFTCICGFIFGYISPSGDALNINGTMLRAERGPVTLHCSRCGRDKTWRAAKKQGERSKKELTARAKSVTFRRV